MSDPSVAVAEAFKQFSQATVSAVGRDITFLSDPSLFTHFSFALTNKGRVRGSVKAEDDLRALRRERDDALRDLNASKEQTQVWVTEVDKWKSEANRELVVVKYSFARNTHQAELVNQLRQEAQQWKDQCLRLEETLRGEIKAWKDQFLRVDAEHTRLLNQQLSAPSSQVRPPRTPFTVRHRLPRRPPQQSTLVPQDSTPKGVPVPLPLIPGEGGNSSAASSATKRRASASASSSAARVDNRLALHLPRVVRRVQAFIEVPVKEEEQEDLEPERPGSALLLQPPSTRRVPSDASDPVGGEGESRSTGGGGGGGDEYVDEEEVENAIASSSPGADGKAVPWGKKHIRHQPDEEDDELMMYAKVRPTIEALASICPDSHGNNLQKVRLPHEIHIPRPPRPKSLTNVAASRLPATDTSARKRRNEVLNSASITRAKRRK
ncbi:hypothetical protein BJY52DRAFT_1383145 [Lactarius psammicola]|nr:hypothetical protein BJY52DRAFT_1383145 [Lactarius psammicola]